MRLDDLKEIVDIHSEYGIVRLGDDGAIIQMSLSGELRRRNLNSHYIFTLPDEKTRLPNNWFPA